MATKEAKCKSFRLSCSDCGEDLVEIYNMMDVPDVYWILRAECPFCGDHSYDKRITGRFYWSNIYDEDPHRLLEDRLPLSVVDDVVIENEKVIFKVSKGEAWKR